MCLKPYWVYSDLVLLYCKEAQYTYKLMFTGALNGTALDWVPHMQAGRQSGRFLPAYMNNFFSGKEDLPIDPQ